MIKIITTKKDFIAYRKILNHTSIGVVPTMGNLHEGHISLLKQSILENKVSVITIFVNPKQFGPTEDFDKYPRTLDADLSKISNIALQMNIVDSEKEIIVFAPSNPTEIYPQSFSTVIAVQNITKKLEGKIRPDHFDGVTTVVYLIFNLIKATNAYFGQKDYQQCAVVKKMVFDLNLDIKINIMPIIRNSEGLALSSRNQFLSDVDKIEALHLSKTLNNILNLITKKNEYITFIKNELLNNKWDYLEVLDSTTLELPHSNSKELVILGAFKLGTTRLLDNTLVQTL
jgi:pantoate--beta-alanine ligase